MSSSAVWVEMGPSDGLAYILYRKGYDVWMLNTRGNIYSREHSRGRLSDKEYWDFSFHEIGIYDIPAAIDYILFATDKPKVQYIGHSQGCTAFFVMGSEKPEYMSKVTLMQALSPTVYNEGNRSPVLKHLGLLKGGFSVSPYPSAFKNEISLNWYFVSDAIESFRWLFDFSHNSAHQTIPQIHLHCNEDNQ